LRQRIDAVEPVESREQQFSHAVATMRHLARRHIVIPDYFTVEECASLLEVAKKSIIVWEPINFLVDGKNGTQIVDPHRYQSRFYWNGLRDGIESPRELSPPGFLKEFCGMLMTRNCGLVDTIWYSCSFLKSDPGAPQQPFHYDDPVFANDSVHHSRIGSFVDAPFSILIALEENTNLVIRHLDRNGNRISEEDEIVHIPVGGMIIFRGDCYHAGSAYDTPNIRLFIATGTEKYIHSGDRVEMRQYCEQNEKK
jgi:hypothetical protein